MSRWGDFAKEISRGLAEAGFTVITEGGPGLMAAANEGAHAAGGASVGLTIRLPLLQEKPNEFLTLEVPFHYFFLRKLSFVKYSSAFVLLPGGFGTLDELFEALNLVRTHRIAPFPVILVGSGFWSGLVEWLREQAVGGGTLSEDALDLMTIVDEPDEVVRIVAESRESLARTVDGG